MLLGLTIFSLILIISIFTGHTKSDAWDILHIWSTRRGRPFAVALLDSERGLSTPLSRSHQFTSGQFTYSGSNAQLSPDYHYLLTIFEPSAGWQLVHLQTNTILELPITVTIQPFPLWSPDSRYIYVQGSRFDGPRRYKGNYLMQVNETGITNTIILEEAEILPETPRNPLSSTINGTWSPDGTQLVYIPVNQPNLIVLYDVISGESETLLDDPTATFGSPTWLTWRDEIAFTRYEEMEDPDSDTIAFRVDVRTLNLISHTVTTNDLGFSTSFNAISTPDRNHLAVAFDDRIEIYTIENFDQNSLLTETVTINVRAQDNMLQWSPTGEELAFVDAYDSQIYVVNVDGSRLHQVTSGEYAYQLIQ